ncbi:LOW QUALITY PROTEIN: hypothetical protein YC2023_042123 [Brassica napus]
MRNGLALRLMREKRKWFSNYLGRQSFLTQNSFHLQQMDADSSSSFFYIYDTETETIPSPLTYGTPQHLHKEFLGILGRQSLKRVDSVIKCFSCTFGFASLQFPNVKLESIR